VYPSARARDAGGAALARPRLGRGVRALGLPTPSYRHQLLLLEERGAKLHGAVGWRALRERYTPEALCGWLAWAAGLEKRPSPARPAELVAGFAWDRVEPRDQVVRWTGAELVRLGASGADAP
jgi:glutamyl-tRNA synthetase/glutamyl-Q tRNA(Asp) synthetase